MACYVSGRLAQSELLGQYAIVCSARQSMVLTPHGRKLETLELREIPEFAELSWCRNLGSAPASPPITGQRTFQMQQVPAASSMTKRRSACRG
jgi:hypothetical protein